MPSRSDAADARESVRSTVPDDAAPTPVVLVAAVLAVGPLTLLLLGLAAFLETPDYGLLLLATGAAFLVLPVGLFKLRAWAFYWSILLLELSVAASLWRGNVVRAVVPVLVGGVLLTQWNAAWK